VPLSVNVGGTWQTATPYVNVGGTWNEVQHGYVNVAGTWQQFFNAAVAPTITSNPTSQSVSAGSAATFSVGASGTAPLSYQWYKNGAIVPSANSSSYTTPAEVESDSGSTFYCVVSNVAGTVTSASATLTVTFTTVTNTYSTAGSYTDTVPTGAAQVVIEVWGSSGPGGNGTGAVDTGFGAGGGASGSYCKTTKSVGPGDWGKTFSVSVDSAGNAANSHVAAGTITSFTTMTAFSGSYGIDAGSTSVGPGASPPSNATGGTDANTQGHGGTSGLSAGGGGGAGGTGIVGTNGTGNRGGAGGSHAPPPNGLAGGAGLVILKYT
jgi:hypothetical protein